MSKKEKSKDKNSKNVEDRYTYKTDHEHVLALPDTYVGSIVSDNMDMWVLDENANKFVKKNVQLPPGLYKIFDEVLVNTRDHTIRDKKCKNIKVDIDKMSGKIVVWNDGGGIPVEMHKEFGAYVPEMIFGNLRTSENYDQTGKIIGGKNGFGAKLANIFSTEFIVETVDSDRKNIINKFSKITCLIRENQKLKLQKKSHIQELVLSLISKI